MSKEPKRALWDPRPLKTKPQIHEKYNDGRGPIHAFGVVYVLAMNRGPPAEAPSGAAQKPAAANPLRHEVLGRIAHHNGHTFAPAFLRRTGQLRRKVKGKGDGTGR